MSYSPLSDLRKPTPLPQPTHGIDDNGMCMTNLPVHLIYYMTSIRRENNVLTFKLLPGIKCVRANICLHVIIRFIPFNSICNMTTFRKKQMLLHFDPTQWFEGAGQVKSKVIVTKKFVRDTPPSIHKFGIPVSNHIGDMLRRDYSRNEVRPKGHSDLKIVCDIKPSKDESTNQIWDAYLK